MKTKILIILSILAAGLPSFSQAAEPDSVWTLEECIDYALEQNIQVRQSELSNESNQAYVESARARRLPSLNASVTQNFGWGNTEDAGTGETSFTGNNSTSYSLNSSLTLFNGMSLNNRIRQAELDLEGGRFNSETIKESVTLEILNAYLQVLFAEENVKNSEKQVEATLQELNLAGERLALSVISRSDYLQVKSQLASEKLTLANARSQLAIARVNLMQLMELPIRDDFTLSHPDLAGFLSQERVPDASSVFSTALSIKPQVRNAALNKESAILEEKIARSDYYPVLSLSAGIGTGFSSLNALPGYMDQLNDQVSPSLGLSLSIPIFQKKQVKTSVAIARIGVRNAELSEIDTRNQLRKDIEQACVDVLSAQTEYEASLEQYTASSESNELAAEKFRQGLINSVDYLFEKTNLITAESQLLQSKYNLIFAYKILDFFSGVPVTL